jgi:hypothetical protein
LSAITKPSGENNAAPELAWSVVRLGLH